MFKLDLKRKAQTVILILLVALVAYAKVTGPEAGYTNAPGDLGNCTACHDTELLNTDSGSVRVDNNPAVYEPGKQYTLNVTVQRPGRSRFGFQLTAIDNKGKRAGTLESISPDTQVLSETGPGGRQYIEHTQPGTFASAAGSRTWQIRWTAPNTDVGTVHFYVAGNAANGNGENGGDFIYANQFVSESETTAVTLNFISNPEGTTLEAGSIFPLEWSATNKSNIDNIEARYSTDDGMTFPFTNLILSTQDSSVTSFEWKVPNKQAAQARIRLQISTKSGTAIEVMSGRFTITNGDPAAQIPQITSVVVSGKKLFVFGENFQMDAVVEVNGDDQKTKNQENFSQELFCKKAGKKIKPDKQAIINVRNPDGSRSADFIYPPTP